MGGKPKSIGFSVIIFFLSLFADMYDAVASILYFRAQLAWPAACMDGQCRQNPVWQGR